MARPKAQIDAADVEKLASFGMTQTEIAEFYGVSKATISRRFVTEWTKGRASLKRSLRMAQTKAALGGNVTMLIWLGKNMLDQSDKQEIDNHHSGKVIFEVVRTDKVQSIPEDAAS